MSYIRVDLSNTNNKWVGFGLANVDTFIIRVGFELVNVDMICDAPFPGVPLTTVNLRKTCVSHIMRPIHE